METVKLKPQKAAPVQPIDIIFDALTTDNAEDKFEDHDVYMCLSWQDYLTLGQYNQELLRYIKQTNEVVKFYEKPDIQPIP